MSEHPGAGEAPDPRPATREEEDHPRLEEARMWNVVSYLLSGPILFGGIGHGLDLWWGTSWLVAVGILAGMALSMYLVWFRYGTS
ncbi:MAG TPA: AtpZ/AtpI family protein [Dermatophilaceae bacterium]|nr:AtpZ/AtpI family protein [Dermatophilaceae bacterium]